MLSKPDPTTLNYVELKTLKAGERVTHPLAEGESSWLVTDTHADKAPDNKGRGLVNLADGVVTYWEGWEEFAIIAPLGRFDCFEVDEISVIEDRGVLNHEPIMSAEERQEALEADGFERTYWCLFGHLRTGGREDLIDRPTLEEINQLVIDLGIDPESVGIEDHR